MFGIYCWHNLMTKQNKSKHMIITYVCDSYWLQGTRGLQLLKAFSGPIGQVLDCFWYTQIDTAKDY